jgi:TatD DNase family protein
MLTDTHSHLDFRDYKNDLEDVLVRAKGAEVERILNPGVDLQSSQAAVCLAGNHPMVFAGVGVHPNEALSWDDSSPGDMKKLAKHPKVRAIGEIGLDYYRDRSPRKVQEKVFRQQLELATELGLPVIIHTRDGRNRSTLAIQDVINILSQWVNELYNQANPLYENPGVLHSYSGDEEFAQQATDLGFMIGITGPVTYKNAQSLQTVVKSIPLENILIETDAPFLTPHPFRGKRNEPAYVRFVAERIAKIRNTTFEEVASATKKNSKRLFNW